MILFSISVMAKTGQLDWDITELKCGNGKLDAFELSEEGVNETWCDEYGVLLDNIYSQGDFVHCTCFPRIIESFCGNDIREGAELCDGTGLDKCGEFGDIIGKPLKCNTATCGCIFEETIPDTYNPDYIEKLEEMTKEESECGNKKIEGIEQCDPPESLCTTNVDDPGICTSDCKCEITEVTGKEVANEKETKENETEEKQEEEIVELEVKEETPGFFKGILLWFIGLFS